MSTNPPAVGALGPTEDMRRAAATPIDCDVEDLQNQPGVLANGDSPSKRTRWDVLPQAAGNTGATPLTLEQLTTQLSAALAPVTGGMRALQDRITSLESEVTSKVGSTLQLIQTVDQRQKVMGAQLEEVCGKVESQAQKTRDQEATIQEVLRRLETLEQEGSGRNPPIWRRMSAASPEDDRDPAVIVGGWGPDTEAEQTLKEVREFIQNRAIPLPIEEAFVPGKQRGFAVVPLTCVGNETHQMMRRAVAAMEATRRLQAKSGHKDAEGKDMVIWAAVSQPPEVRRKAKLVAKTKKAVLESYEKSGNKAGNKELAVKADYRRGTLHLEGREIGGSLQPASGEILVCDHGWVDAALVCQYTKEVTQEFADRWHKLVDMIN